MLSAALFATAFLSAQAYPYIGSRDSASSAAQEVLVNSYWTAQLRDPICAQIAEATSALTSVFYPGEPAYEKDISHWTSSSTQRAKCSVQPDTAADVSIILKIVGSTRTPFAVKCGGHASNPGFSSTTGVHISMSRFSEVTYDASTQTAIVGGGLVWDDAYSALAPFNVTVVGGRKSGVGVAGFALGGGYSWLSNQYGLTIDTIVAYELVKPNGDIVTVTQTDPGLFSSLKGGMSNFGIVTRFTFKTFPQGRVWGGLILFKSIAISAITEATAKFSALVTDPKAAIITSYTALPGEPGISLHLFYDGPNPPPGIFDEFLKIPFYEKNVKTRKFLDLVQVFPVGDTYGQRGIFNGVSIPQYTPRILDVIANETVFWAARLMPFSASDVDYGVQPFLPTLFSHGDYESSAYPPVRGKHNSPLNIYYAWSEERFDGVFHDAARMSAARIRAAVVEEGQDVRDAAVYPNYAIYDTPLEAMYGSRVGVLKALKKEVDPMNVMGLTGGFRF